MTVPNGESETHYSYSIGQRLSSAVTHRYTSGILTSVSEEYYRYDHNGNRISTRRMVNEDADPYGMYEVNEVTTYLMNSANPTGYTQVLEEWLADGWEHPQTLRRSYLLGLDVIGQADAGTAPEPITLIYDGHGSTRRLADSTGALVAGQAYTYDAFGNLKSDQTAETVQTPLLYSGEWTNLDTGLQYLRARHYDPSVGRFTRMDPFAGNIQDPQSLHKYLYCHGDPVNGIDPTGRFAVLGGTLLGFREAMSARANWESQRLPMYTTALRLARATARVIPSLCETGIISMSVVAGYIAVAKLAYAARYPGRTVPKVVPMPYSVIPSVARHVASHQTRFGGLFLTRAPIGASMANRRAVLAGRGWAGLGMSWDEYPFASSIQGGNPATATVVSVPLIENLIQGGIMSGSYLLERITPGTSFAVVVVP